MPGSTTNATFSEYIYFDGKRAARRDYQSNVFYYFADQVGSARGMFEVVSGSHTASPPCFDADFYPFGGEHDFLNSCPQNYKFMGKERDPETNNDDFGARSYASAYGRFLSADWSSTPTPVPYANLTNPQTLNLYAMVSDNPESFADLDGHSCHTQSSASQATNACVEPPPPPDPGNAQNQTPPAQGVLATITKEAMEEVDKIAKPLIDSATKAVEPLAEDVAKGVSATLGTAAIVVTVAVALTTVAAPSVARDEDMLPAAQNSSKKNTNDKHTKSHPSRPGGDKLRKRDTWKDKKFGDQGNKKRNNDHTDSN